MTVVFGGVVALVGVGAAAVAAVAGFGIASAAGGLIGALAHVWISSRALAVVFGIVVALAGVSEFTGWMRRVHWSRLSAWIAGTCSGVLGGMVGNQGGIRTAAMLGFNVPKESFVATSTAIGLFVDAARLPVYAVTEWRAVLAIWPLVLTATVAVIIGTSLGTRMLGQLPQQLFRRLIAVLLIVLGIYMATSAGAHARYQPRVREITITTVPLLVKEQQKMLPFLQQDFAEGGVLAGKEVYAFSPSTITVIEGDTLRFTFINPEDDLHSFVLPDFAVQLPPGKIIHATYVAKRAGIFPFVCAIPAHLPMMAGQLVVLPAARMSW